jgi:hypothetical protein
VIAEEPLRYLTTGEEVGESNAFGLNFLTAVALDGILSNPSELAVAPLCASFDPSPLNWLPEYNLDHTGRLRVSRTCGAFGE